MECFAKTVNKTFIFPMPTFQHYSIILMKGMSTGFDRAEDLLLDVIQE